jgi:hypothetical protein
VKAKKGPRYKTPGVRTLFRLFKEFMLPLEQHAVKHLKLDWERVRWDEQTITKILEMVNQDEVRIRMFSDTLEEIDEQKRGALLSYYIQKFRPFWLEDDDTPQKVNLHFAVYYFLSGIRFCLKRNGLDSGVSETAVNYILKEYRYGNLSKESVLLISKGLVEQTLYANNLEMTNPN